MASTVLDRKRTMREKESDEAALFVLAGKEASDRCVMRRGSDDQNTGRTGVLPAWGRGEKGCYSAVVNPYRTA